jgi:hypothetical protein
VILDVDAPVVGSPSLVELGQRRLHFPVPWTAIIGVHQLEVSARTPKPALCLGVFL